MNLICLGSGSAGNCYILESSSGEVLVIEVGISWTEVIKAVKFKTSRIAGALCGHMHQDHCKEIYKFLLNGIPVYTSRGTLEAKGLTGAPLTRPIAAGDHVQIGSFQVKAFDIHHDVPEPLGFLIWHEEMGLTLFLTDTYYCDYRFSGLNHILIEANYAPERLERGKLFLKNRTMSSHMSIETCLHTLRSTDLSNVVNIVLIHLSDSNSDEEEFIRQTISSTGKRVFSADKGLVIPFNKTPF